MDCCVQGSICFEMMKGVPAAFVTLIIGGIAGLLTLRQYQVAKAKLKLDLFEKRYAIFHKTWVILSDVVIRGTREDHHGLATPFNNFLPEAAFLFGNEIFEYLDELSTKWNELHGLQGERIDLAGPERLKNIARTSELEKWFFDQASTEAKLRFSSYMDFKNWK
jgi:hypothetical protein